MKGPKSSVNVTRLL